VIYADGKNSASHKLQCQISILINIVWIVIYEVGTDN